MQLIARELSGGRDEELLFEGLDFTIQAGQALLVTGPNGSGKSTLLRTIAGLLPVFSGVVRLEDEAGVNHPIGAMTHYLGHADAMKSSLSVKENLGFWQSFLGATGIPVELALETVGLGGLGHLPFASLSTGQKRRVGLARLLVTRLPLWLLDEPNAGLDSEADAMLARIASEHLDSGGLLVAAVHQPLALHGAAELGLG